MPRVVAKGRALKTSLRALPRDVKPRQSKRDPNLGWEAEVWRYFIGRAIGNGRVELPGWAHRPALVRFGATSPRLLAPFEAKLASQPYRDRIKPFNFLSGVRVAEHGTPVGANPKRCRLVAPFERDPAKWFALVWYDLYSAIVCRLSLGEVRPPGTAVIDTVNSVVKDYWLHPEAKSLGPDGRDGIGTTRGLLQRRPVGPSRIDALGKETNRLEEAELDLIDDKDEVQAVYRPANRRQRAEGLRCQLIDVPAPELAREMGISLRTAFRFRAGLTISKKGLASIERAVRRSSS